MKAYQQISVIRSLFVLFLQTEMRRPFNSIPEDMPVQEENKAELNRED